MRAKVQQAVDNLRLAIVDDLSKRGLRIDLNDNALRHANFNSIARRISQESSVLNLKQFGVEPTSGERTIEKQLQKMSKDPDRLKDLCRVVGEQLFVSGKISLSGLHRDTAHLLIGVVTDLAKVRSEARALSYEGLLRNLRGIDKKIQNFLSDTRAQDKKGKDGGENEATGRLNTIGYAAVNKQHVRIAKAIKAVERTIIKDLPKKVRAVLETRPLFTSEELRSDPKQVQRHISALCSQGIVHACTLDNREVYAYAHGAINQERFEACLSTLTRELLGTELASEMKQKYSGKQPRLGIAESREDGVPSLLDKTRVHDLCERTGLKAGHIVLGLKYFSNLGLLERDEDGYVLSKMGAGVGLGIRAVEAVRRVRTPGDPEAGAALLDAFLAQASRERANVASASYRVQTSSAGMPLTVIMDEIRFPSRTFHSGLLRAALDRSKKADVSVVGGVIAGDPYLNRRGTRNWTQGVQSLGGQIPLATELFSRLENSVLHVSGKVEDAVAERRGYLQALREKEISEGKNDKVDEGQVHKRVEKLNDQRQYTEAASMALKVSDWSQFISLVAQPLEYRLGRALHDSGKIRAEVGIDMNELEIIRAISGQITQHGSLSDAQKSIRSRFGAYLEFLEQTDPEILKKLEYVLDPAKENVLPGRVVSRNGMRLACEQKRGGAPQYDVQIVPSNNYGNLPRATPTAAYEGLLRARLNEGKPIAPMHILLDTGETIGELSSHGAWIISGGTMQASDTALPDGYFNLSRGRERRDATVYGRGPQSSFVVVSGGVHDNKITQAIEYQIVTPKLLDVLESNKKRGLPKRTVKLYVTSDWQIGSPTMKPAMILSGLIDAIKGGCEEILINGDISQGMNYLRYTQEAQLVEHPLNGIDSQARFIYYLLEPAIDYAWKRAKKDQNFKLPRWRIVPGNHETNSQANKGLQGTWFVHPFAEKIKENYAARLDDREKANTYVICPEKYIDHDGTQVDYPLLYVNKTEETGICIQMTHYNNSGSKGSSFAPTVSKVANAVHSLGAVEPHIRIESHMHVSGFQVRNGVVAVRTGANATGSAFEQHLLYENCPESNLHITLDSHDVPRFFVATRAYQETRDAALMAELHKHGVLLKYESFEKYCLDKRQEVSPKNGGNPTNLMTEQFHGPHKRGSVIPTRGTH